MRNSRRRRQTKRKSRNQNLRKYVAGDVTRNEVLTKILSIGYEFETSTLAKLTGIVEKNKLVGFLNTDTAREDIGILTTVENTPEFFSRQAELLEMAKRDSKDIDSYEKHKKIAEMTKAFEMNRTSYEKRKNEVKELRLAAYSDVDNETKFPKNDVSFFATNDIAESPLVKHLNSICQEELLRLHIEDVDKAIDESGLSDMKDEIISIIEKGYRNVLEKLEELFKYEESDDEEYKANIIKFYEFIADIYKQRDTYYKFQRLDDNSKPIYDIHFEMWTDATCGTFADVEWVITYYNPILSNNIVLDTFINAIENLTHHLSDYVGEMRGNLLYTVEYPGGEVSSIVSNPYIRKIFYNPYGRPQQNYYLQTQFRKDLDREFTLDDCTVTPQMTFSTLIEDVFTVMKYLTQDSISDKEDTAVVRKYTLLENIEKCMNELINKYNESGNAYLLLPDDENEEKKVFKAQLIMGIKNYIGLILLKLYVYINDYLTTDPSIRTYLKDQLSFNSRHKNYALYTATKELIRELFQGEQLSNETIAEIIQHLVVDEKVLTKYLLEEGHIQEGAYSIKKVIKRDSGDIGEEYGDPTVSMLSYFQFFENPVRENNIADENGELVNEDEEGEEDNNNFKYRDWLEYSKIDIYSAQMEIQKYNGRRNKILIEFRGFSSILIPYELNMAEGDSSILFGETRPMNTIGSFKRLISLYNEDESYPVKGVIKGGKKKTKRHRKNKTRPSSKN